MIMNGDDLSVNKTGILPIAFIALVLIILLDSSCTNPVDRNDLKPVITSIVDTTVRVRDSIFLVAHSSETGGLSSKFNWWLNGKKVALENIHDSICTFYFQVSDTGKQIICLQAITKNNIASDVETTVVHVVLDPPSIVRWRRDTTVFVNDSLFLSVNASDQNGSVRSIVWSLDSGKTIVETDGFSSVWVFGSLPGAHTIIMTAIDNDSILSEPETTTVHTIADVPMISLPADTSVSIRDSLWVTARRIDTFSNTLRYIWARTDGIYRDTTQTGRYCAVYRKSDVGLQKLYARALNVHKLISQPDSMLVSVSIERPSVLLGNDTSVFINNSCTITATGKPNARTKTPILFFLWSQNGKTFSDTTISNLISIRFGKSDTGTHKIFVKAVDRDTIESLSDSLTVHVSLGLPKIVKTNDTSLVRTDTLRIKLRASDTNGTIRNYYLKTVDTSGFSDSSLVGEFSLTSQFPLTNTVVFGAKDNDGLFAFDTMTVTFKQVPCTITLTGQSDFDTVVVRTQAPKILKTQLSFSAKRSDTVQDTFTYVLMKGFSRQSLGEVYRGRTPVCTLQTADTGTYFIKVTAFDTHNDSVMSPLVQKTVLMQNRICFIGHSIITGLFGETGRGGFRRSVIDSLRRYAGSAKRIGCDGPIKTNALYPPEDDSTLAENGRTSADMYDSLMMHPNAIADIWVHMLGTNEEYAVPTYNAKYGFGNFAVASIDSIHARNPKSEIYVLNGLPLPKDTAGNGYVINATFRRNLHSFNRMMDSVVTSRRSDWTGKGQAGVWLVDVFKPMSNLPSDSTYNQIYFSDFIHPNQSGYELMGKELLKTMRAASSFFYR